MNKKPIEEVVTFEPYDKEANPEYGYLNGPGYTGLIESLGVDIIVCVEDDDYQGDSYLVVGDGERKGALTFGWGSCSGCDAYEGCSSIKDMAELRDSLEAGIVWFDSLPDLKDYIAAPENFHSWREDDDPSNSVTKFKREVAAL